VTTTCARRGARGPVAIAPAIGTAALAAMLSAAPAMPAAAEADRPVSYRYADVVEVEPVYRTVRVDTPYRECRDEQVTYYETRRGYNHRYYAHGHHGGGGSALATITGGLIGGLIGHQFGDGGGRQLATLGGAIAGAAIGHDHAARRRYHYREHYSYPRTYTRERCEVHHSYSEEERLDGYRVTYEYDGELYSTFMHRHPGDRIRVHVRVTPAEG